jgi:hypothetical protein
MKKLILVVSLLYITACSSLSEEEIALEREKIAYAKAVATQPTLHCKSECIYIDPKKNQVRFEQATNGWDFANTLLNTVSSTAIAVAPWVAVADITSKAIVNAGHNTSIADSNNDYSQANSADVSNVTNTTTETVSTNTATNTTTTTTTTENSHNNSSDNSVDTDNSSQVEDNSSSVVNPVPEEG